MTTSDSTSQLEGESTSSPFPSTARLVAALVFISIGCVGLHFGLFMTPAAFSVATWLFMSNTEKLCRLRARDCFLLFAVIGVMGVIVVTLHGKQFPAFERFYRHPAFLTAVWLLLCSLYIRRWRILRRTPRANSNEPGNA